MVLSHNETHSSWIMGLGDHVILCMLVLSFLEVAECATCQNSSRPWLFEFSRHLNFFSLILNILHQKPTEITLKNKPTVVLLHFSRNTAPRLCYRGSCPRCFDSGDAECCALTEWVVLGETVRCDSCFVQCVPGANRLVADFFANSAHIFTTF